MLVRRAFLCTVMVASLAGAASACTALQESLECPGDDCPAALQSVADDAAGVPGVTGVDRAWRFFNFDKGHSGGVDVHASVDGESAAQEVARKVATIYEQSEVEPVDQVSVGVVPDPERAEPHEGSVTLGGDVSDLADVSCAAEECVDQVAGFSDAFAASDLGEVATLESAAWVGERYPKTVIEVTAPDELMDPAAFRELENQVLDIAQSAGLPDIGDVRTVISYQRRVEFSFSFDTDKRAED